MANVEAAEARRSLKFAPQKGPQRDLLGTEADIAIIGGAAGGGKTWSLLVDPIRWVKTKESAVIFRRTYPQITNPGGLWDEAKDIYPYCRGMANNADHEYRFESGFKIRFAHLQHDKDKQSWDGAQIPIIMFDQLESFEESQFWYMMSRNRSATAPFRPYIRASCNPVPEDDEVGGWLNKLVSWWIDPETGYAIQSRSGVVRWFVRFNEQLVWGDDAGELRDAYGEEPKSFTFIPATLSDNPILTDADPSYLATLRTLPMYERERLQMGNWKVRPESGNVFDRAWFKLVDAVPGDVDAWIRYWDKAGTEGGSGAQSAGVLMGRYPVGMDPVTKEPFYKYIIADVITGRWSTHMREKTIKETAAQDAQLAAPVKTYVEREPGSGGKESAEMTIMRLKDYDVHEDLVTGPKLVRAGPFSAQCEAGNVSVVRAPWTEAYRSEHHRFDGRKGLMDQVDSSGGAYNKLVLMPIASDIGAALW